MEDKTPTTATNAALCSRVIIDALNVAYWLAAPPTLRLPLGLATGLLAQGRTVHLYFDANTPYLLSEAEREIYTALIAITNLATQAPSGRCADSLLLPHAHQVGAVIISRDRYRDHRRRYRRLIKDPQRLFGGFIEQDMILIPPLALQTPLPASAELAWQQLQVVLATPQPPATLSPPARAPVRAP